MNEDDLITDEFRQGFVREFDEILLDLERAVELNTKPQSERRDYVDPWQWKQDLRVKLYQLIHDEFMK